MADDFSLMARSVSTPGSVDVRVSIAMTGRRIHITIGASISSAAIDIPSRVVFFVRIVMEADLWPGDRNIVPETPRDDVRSTSPSMRNIALGLARLMPQRYEGAATSRCRPGGFAMALKECISMAALAALMSVSAAKAEPVDMSTITLSLIHI